jgi:hypothetical protein
VTAWQARADIGDRDLVGAAPAASLDINEQLLLVNRIARLQGVRTEPGSGDRDFVRSLRGVRPALLSDKQRAHVLRLAWRYRIQLPEGLRPDADPDTARCRGAVP